MTTSAGLIENAICWVEPASTACREMRDARYSLDLAEITHQQSVAESEAASAAAQQGAQQAVSEATFSQLAWTFAIALPPLVLIGLGIGGYLWYRNKKREELSSTAFQQELLMYGEEA